MSQITCKNQGFTLAEVLITLVIIGVVAVFTLPVLLQEVSMRVNSNRQANIAQKITKSVETMIVNGDYENITNTEEFVDKLSKYLKIAKRCSSTEIDNCWPTKKVKTPSGGIYEVKNAKKGTNIHVNSNENNVGIVLADGASIILSFNPEASTPSAENGFTASNKSLPIGKNKYKEFAYTSNATNAIDFVMDVNGGTGPNQEPSNEGEYYDIRPFRIALFSKPDCLGFKVNGTCVVNLDKNYSYLDCTNSDNAKYCSGSKLYALDYWAGANKTCLSSGMKLPSPEEYSAMSSLLNIDISQCWSNFPHPVSASHNGSLAKNGSGQYKNRTLQYTALCINK